jgi:chorismate mutase-like protein
MDIPEWRRKIDELDRKLVELLNERARCAREIGRLKQNTNIPIYEPERERTIYENVRRANGGPLPDRELTRIYERLIDVMRKIQKEEIAPPAAAAHEGGDTEMEAEVND